MIDKKAGLYVLVLIMFITLFYQGFVLYHNLTKLAEYKSIKEHVKSKSEAIRQIQTKQGNDVKSNQDKQPEFMELVEKSGEFKSLTVKPSFSEAKFLVAKNEFPKLFNEINAYYRVRKLVLIPSQNQLKVRLAIMDQSLQ